jgi:hypothetical protein
LIFSKGKTMPTLKLSPAKFRTVAQRLLDNPSAAVSDRAIIWKTSWNKPWSPEKAYLFQLREEDYEENKHNPGYDNSFYQGLGNETPCLLCLMVAEGIKQGMLP